MRTIYVDYAATTPMDHRVFEAMKPYFASVYGNASSIHALGLEARRAIDDARKTVAGSMNAEPEELIFTGSATEANNQALKSFAFKEGKERAKIAISTVEHDSVLNTARWLEKQGFRVQYLPVDSYGIIDLGELENVLTKGVGLVSVIHGNNEIGTIQPTKEIGELCHEYGAYFHSDAAQSFGKVPIDVKAMNIDLMTVNAHKIYGPKGVGALHIRKGIRMEPLLHGGGHEFGLRSGTENVPGIMGFAKAVELRRTEMSLEAQVLTKLRDRLIKGALEIKESYLNGHPARRLPNNVNIRFSFIEGESLLLLLNDEGVYASTGSACSSGTGEPSHVLLAIGLRPEEVHGSLRLSLGKHNSEEEIKYILDILPRSVRKLRDISPIKAEKSGKE